MRATEQKNGREFVLQEGSRRVEVGDEEGGCQGWGWRRPGGAVHRAEGRRARRNVGEEGVDSEGRRGRGACVRNSYRALTEAG